MSDTAPTSEEGFPPYDPTLTPQAHDDTAVPESPHLHDELGAE